MKSRLIYYQNRKPSILLFVLLGIKIVSVTTMAMIVILVALGYNNLWVVLSSVIMGNVFILYNRIRAIRKDKSSFKIYADSIEFFSYFDPDERDVVELEQIYQARYEDDFGENVEKQIYLYLKSGHNLVSKKVKNDRIVLGLELNNWREDVITILKFFKENKKQVYISTRYEEIKMALGLKNWTEP